MVLMYHDVDRRGGDRWCVSPEAFRRQMEAIRKRGLRVVPLDDYDPSDPRQAVITFDDGYASLVANAAPALRGMGWPFEVFVVGEQPADAPAPYLDEDGMRALVAAGGRLQWHTMTHANLRLCPPERLAAELEAPERLRRLDPDGFRYFAYPYGEWSPAAEAEVRRRFDGAVVIGAGRSTRDRHRIERFAVFEGTDPAYLGLSRPAKALKALARLDLRYLLRR